MGYSPGMPPGAVPLTSTLGRFYAAAIQTKLVRSVHVVVGHTSFRGDGVWAGDYDQYWPYV